MSNFKRATLVGGAPPRNVLGGLRDVKIIEFKPKLPLGKHTDKISALV
jgi:hypothetical protein